jgi:uncharacterized membrane protein
MTGFSVMCRKRDVLALDATFEEAVHFVVSCGVVVPARQAPTAANRAARRAAAEIAAAEKSAAE